MPLDKKIMNRPRPPLVARHSTERRIREFVVQHERHMISCEREGRDDEAVSIYDIIGDAVMDAVCSCAFRGRSSLDHITEEDILEELIEEAGMLHSALSTIEFEMANKNIIRMKQAIAVAERTLDFNIGLADMIIKNGLRSAVRRRFSFMLQYGRLLVEAML